MGINKNFLSGKQEFMDLVYIDTFDKLKGMGYKEDYLNKLPSGGALIDLYQSNLRKQGFYDKAKGGTNVTKDFRKTGMFYKKGSK